MRSGKTHYINQLTKISTRLINQVSTAEEQRMRPGNLLESVFCISFSTFDTDGWVTARTSGNVSVITKDSFLERVKETKAGIG